jgi:hypothetical protein
MLMVGIHATGNWGFFNIGYILLAVCLLDVHGSIFDLAREPWVSRLGSWPDLAVHGAMAALFVVSLFYLSGPSWCPSSRRPAATGLRSTRAALSTACLAIGLASR